MLIKSVKIKAIEFLEKLGVDTDFISERGLPSFVDATNLVVADVSQSGREHELVLDAANAWQKMKSAAYSQDINLIIISAYRSFARQCEIVQHSIDHAEDIASLFKTSAPPGYSEHHSGKAIDIGTMGCKPLSQEFGETAAFNWLVDNAKDFGFRLSYPENNKYGFKFEPWHWFYVGRVDIRKVTLFDIHELRDLGVQTFSEAFSEDNDLGNMQNYLADKFNIEQLSKEIENPESDFYFAEIDNKPVGYLKINSGSAQTDNSLQDALEIERIYVLKAHHGQAIGKLLFDKALQISKELRMQRIWLGVWEHNTEAIEFYQRQGFEKFAEHPFALGDKVDIDWLMKLEL